jgi:hypothetical protein
VTDLSGLHKVRHGADGVLDGDRRVDAVLVVQVDVVDPEPPQRGVARGGHIGGVAVDSGVIGIEDPFEAEFGRENHFGPPRLDRGPYQLLVVPQAIDVRCVQQGHARVQRGVDGRH